MTRQTVASLSDRLAALERVAAEGIDLLPAVLSERTVPVVVAPWASVRKALAAGILGGLGALGTTLLDGTLTTAEAYASLGAGVLAATGAYIVRNQEPEPGD